RRYVEALIELDGKNGWRVVRRLSRNIGLPSEAIADLREFPEPLTVEDILYIVKGVILTAAVDPHRQVFGYTIVDSIRGILTLSGMEFYYLLGMTSERVVVFTNVTIGRSPMIAVRVSPVKPSVIVIHGPRGRVDPLALKLAELERIPLILSMARDLDELRCRLASAAED
ncbi:MAG: transcriptional regulator, partial [Desulfurococcales archaeon]|nr:transcriptional regulator [Desulfurococcales archaeon]